MGHYEMPLVLFTVISQWGIGAVLAITCHQAFASCGAQVLQGRELRGVAVVVFLITAAGSAMSLGHLGTPLGAYRAVLGIAHSWLSREVIAYGALNGLIALWALSCWLQPEASARNQVLGWICSVFGFGTILVTAQIYYQMIIHPLWHTPATQMSFIGTALLLGFATVLLALKSLQREPAGILRWGLGLGWLLVLASLIVRFQIVGADAGSYLLWWQIAAVLAGVIILLVGGGQRWGAPALCVLGLLFVTGELAGRMLYYGNVMSGAPWF